MWGTQNIHISQCCNGERENTSKFFYLWIQFPPNYAFMLLTRHTANSIALEAHHLQKFILLLFLSSSLSSSPFNFWSYTTFSFSPFPPSPTPNYTPSPHLFLPVLPFISSSPSLLPLTPPLSAILLFSSPSYPSCRTEILAHSINHKIDIPTQTIFMVLLRVNTFIKVVTNIIITGLYWPHIKSRR